MEKLRSDLVRPPAWRPPEPEPTATTTAGVTRDRAAIVGPDRALMAAPPSVLARVPSDDALDVSPASTATLSVLGLGALPADTPGLRRQLAMLVRAQGVEAVEQSIRRARAGVEELRDRLRRHGGARGHAVELLRRLDVLQAGLRDIKAQRAAVRTNLQPHVVDEAHRTLDASAARADRLERQYFHADGRPRAAALAALRVDAQRLLEARRNLADPAARARFASLHAELSARHPILAGFGPDAAHAERLEMLAGEHVGQGTTATVYTPRMAVQTVLHEVRGAIDDMRATLRTSPSAVWRLPTIVQATLVRAGVPRHGMVAALARDVVRAQASDARLTRALVSVLAVGLGLAAALPSGGTSAAVAGAVTAAVDGYQLYAALEDYAFEAAASGTDVDPRAALSQDVPSSAGLVLDALGTLAGAGGVLAHVRKTPFVQLLGDPGPTGDMARHLARHLGRDEAGRFVSAVGPEEAGRAFAAVPREVWAGLDGPSAEAALRHLGADDFAAWAAELGPAAFARLVSKVPPEAWRHLLSTGTDAQAALRITERFEPSQIAALAPVLKGRGLDELAAHLKDVPFVAHADHVLVDGQLRLHPHELLKLARTGGLDARRATLRELREQSPTLRALGPLSPRNLEDLSRLVDDARAGRPLDKAARKQLTRTTGEPESVWTRVAREVAGPPVGLPPRARALAEAAPELREGLEALFRSRRIPPDLRESALERLERAIRHQKAHFDRPHLGDLLTTAVHESPHAAARLESHLLELDYALHAADTGKVADGSTVFLGVKAGETVRLAPNGPTMTLPPPMPGVRGQLEDIDVLYLTPRGEVQLVEVKRSGKALWHKLDSTEGRYLERFADWRSSSSEGAKRRVSVAIRSPDPALDARGPQDLSTRAHIATHRIELIEGW